MTAIEEVLRLIELVGYNYCSFNSVWNDKNFQIVSLFPSNFLGVRIGISKKKLF